MNRYLKFISVAGAAILAALCAFAFVASVYAGTSFFAVNKTGYETYSFFAATTTSATSTNQSGGGGYLIADGAQRISVFFQRGGLKDPNIGTSTFKVQVSPDGSSWYDFGLFISATSTTQTQYGLDGTRGTVVLGTGTGNGTSTVMVGLDLTKSAFHGVRCIVVETVDGEHTCQAAVQF